MKMAKFQSAVKQVIKTKSTVDLLENRLEEEDDDDDDDDDVEKLTRNMERNREEEEENPEDLSKPLSFRTTVMKLFETHSTLDKIELQPFTKRVLYPSKPGASKQRVPVNGGLAIAEDLAITLRTFAFGPADMVSFTSGDWFESSFGLHEGGTNKAWSLKVFRAVTKGLIMCVQAHFIKHLLFSRRRTRGSTDLKILMRPDRKTQEECLASAFSDILWKAGDKQRATLCLLHAKEMLENTEFFRGDGITEKIRIFNFKKQDDLTFNIKKYMYQFVDDEKEDGGGTALILYSLILTRGIDKLKTEMEESEPSVVLRNGTLRRSIANLMITGRATPYLHNGIIYEGTEATMALPRTGTLLRSEIGFLIWEGSKTDIRIQVGSRLKTPSFPIWVTLCEENYGLLFNPNKDLMRDYHAENRFDLLYFSGHSSQSNLTTLTIDTREPSYLDLFSSPPLELLIQTKWEDASVEWNGEEPYV